MWGSRRMGWQKLLREPQNITSSGVQSLPLHTKRQSVPHTENFGRVRRRLPKAQVQNQVWQVLRLFPLREGERLDAVFRFGVSGVTWTHSTPV